MDTATKSTTSRRIAGVPVYPAVALWAKYNLMEVIGEGSYGVVWRAMERSTGTEFACKQLPRDSSSADAVLREIEMMGAVKGHQNVVNIVAVYEDADWLYIVMELCTAGDMLHRINEACGLDEKTAAKLFRQLVSALKHCHDNGVVHRDIKPENVLLHFYTSPSGEQVETVKLADFGLAVSMRPKGYIRGYAGSFPYEAPEVMALKQYDESADVWSLGVLLFGMLVATLPQFTDKSRTFCPEKEFADPIWDPISYSVKSLIARMLSKRPADRPSLAEVLEDAWFAKFAPLPVVVRSAGAAMTPPASPERRSFMSSPMRLAGAFMSAALRKGSSGRKGASVSDEARESRFGRRSAEKRSASPKASRRVADVDSWGQQMVLAH